MNGKSSDKEVNLLFMKGGHLRGCMNEWFTFVTFLLVFTIPTLFQCLITKHIFLSFPIETWF
jgi:hypothetical protein